MATTTPIDNPISYINADILKLLLFTDLGKLSTKHYA